MSFNFDQFRYTIQNMLNDFNLKIILNRMNKRFEHIDSTHFGFANTIDIRHINTIFESISVGIHNLIPSQMKVFQHSS